MDITYFIYEPHNSFSVSVDKDGSRCVAIVHEKGRGARFYQCQRNGSETVEGYLFCSQHATNIKTRLGIKVDSFTKWAVSSEYDSPGMAKVQVISETEKTINIQSSKEVFGTMFLSTGQQSKRSSWNRRIRFFDTAQEALEWLIEEYVKSLQAAEDRISNIITQIEKLEKMRHEI